MTTTDARETRIVRDGFFTFVAVREPDGTTYRTDTSTPTTELLELLGWTVHGEAKAIHAFRDTANGLKEDQARLAKDVSDLNELLRGRNLYIRVDDISGRTGRVWLDIWPADLYFR